MQCAISCLQEGRKPNIKTSELRKAAIQLELALATLTDAIKNELEMGDLETMIALSVMRCDVAEMVRDIYKMGGES